MTTEIPDARSKPPSRRFWMKVIAVSLLILALMALPLGYYYFIYDEAPLSDAELQMPAFTVPDAQNGFVQLAKLSKNHLDFIAFAKGQGADAAHAQDILDQRVRDDDLVAAYFVQAKPDLDLIDASVAQPYFEYPGAYDPTQGMLFSKEFLPLFNAAQAIDLSGRLALARGDYIAASQEIRRLHHLAARLLEGYPIGIQILIAASINRFADRLGLNLLNDPALPSNIETQLSTSYEHDLGWIAAMQREMKQDYHDFVFTYLAPFATAIRTASTQNALGRLTPHGFWARNTFRANQTRNAIVRIYVEVLHELNGPYPGINPRARAQDALFAFDPKDRWEHFRPNYAGRTILSLRGHPLQMGIDAVYISTADDDLLRVGFALRHYFEDRHALPTKLDELVPQYLSAIPTDPYNGQPLGYDSASAAVFSVGKTLTPGSHKSVPASSKGTTQGDANALGDDEHPALHLRFQNSPAPAIIPSNSPPSP